MAMSRGDCESAIVGGANLITTPGSILSLTEQNLLSRDGSCKTFSGDANGYARGEAIAAVYKNRLDHALRDDNSIRAVIRGTVNNQNGKTPGITVSSTSAQKVLIRRLYNVAVIANFLNTGFVE